MRERNARIVPSSLSRVLNETHVQTSMALRTRFACNKCVLTTLLLSLGWVYFAEVLIYPFYSTFVWDTTYNDTIPEDSLRVLVITDLHIMCTMPAVETWIARWDADRYLKKSLDQAIAVFEPHVVLILGDVFDQGYNANSKEWVDYLSCLRHVVALPRKVHFMSTVGDNDIGGEGWEPISSRVLERYHVKFGKMNSLTVIDNIAFIKVNTVPLLRSSPMNEDEAEARHAVEHFVEAAELELQQLKDVHTRVMFTHVPLQYMGARKHASALATRLQPNYYLAGHVHRYMHQVYGSGASQLEEYVIPTCNYRMGQSKMGVAAVRIGKGSQFCLTILWFPPRFPILVSYLLLVLILACTQRGLRRRVCMCCTR